MANLYTLLKAREKQVRKICRKELTSYGYDVTVDDDFIYAPGTIPVLLMAHYDTVFKEPPRYIRNKNGILSGKAGLGADDRAGIYSVLEIAREHHVHVLFTGGEEIGCVGAEAFTRSGIQPEVNYIIELDRRGENDAVYYEGDSAEFEDFITSFGWETKTGSFTDICVVAPYIGAMAVNLSIGYQNEHRADETLDTAVMNKNIARVKQMLDGEFFEWKEVPQSFKYDWYGHYGSYFGASRSSYYGWDEEDFFYWEVEFTDPLTLESDVEWVEGASYSEAVGNFLISHPNITFNDITSVHSDWDDFYSMR